MDDFLSYGKYEPTGFMLKLIDVVSNLPDNWIGRRSAFFLRSFAMVFLKRKPVDIERFGAKMRLFPSGNACEKRILFTPQYFDREEFDILKQYIEEKQDGFCFVDVGANIGIYSLFAANCAHNGARILAVEPQSVIFDRLIYNIQQNSQGYIKAVSCAVADKTGEITLFINYRDRGRSSIRIVDTAQGSSVRVPSVTLLELLNKENFSGMDILKLDVEGAEDLILSLFFQDAPESLYPELIMIENARKLWQAEIPTLLEKNGYRFLKKTRTNLIFERKMGSL